MKRGEEISTKNLTSPGRKMEKSVASKPSRAKKRKKWHEEGKVPPSRDRFNGGKKPSSSEKSAWE